MWISVVKEREFLYQFRIVLCLWCIINDMAYCNNCFTFYLCKKISMWFTQKKIQPLWFVENTKVVLIGTLWKTLLWLVLSVIVLIGLYVTGFLSSTWKWATDIGNNFLANTTKTLSQTFGKEMQKDDHGNINVLLVWYGGKDHAGGYLADSIIVASYDPKLHSVSLISLPRDLIVNASGYVNKINAVMAYKYNKTRELSESAHFLANKVKDVTWLTVPYYVLVDFDGFAELIDAIGGIEVDVPKRIYDTTYPWLNWTYTTFILESWLQLLDGQTALKYARSRHTTSDFSRSQRQQLIIKSLLQKITKWWKLSVNSLRQFYLSYKSMVDTNIELDEMLGLLNYGRQIPQLHSFWYTMECSNEVLRTMSPACLLYPTDSEQFNGMSGLLPVGASSSNISFYERTRYFADQVAHNQWYLNENLPIIIYNATDKGYAKQFTYRNSVATKLAVKLKRYAFHILDTNNASYSSTGTTAVVYASWDYKETIRMLRLFLNIDEVQTNPLQSDGSGNILPPVVNIYLGNNYLDQVWNSPFNYYK